ncbi:tetratricopeptide repeat protein [Leptospira kirschneri]|uniref:tetratricopeptide repeat protein n=1 Tax=Leptospira kirschneri TaxID=29507 RepID=UPI0004A3AF12|nr:tetratricopeptide repeat protein [Leptospira kirschneri]
MSTLLLKLKRIFIFFLLLCQLHCATFTGTLINKWVRDYYESTNINGVGIGLAGDGAISIYAGTQFGLAFGLAYAAATIVALPFIFFGLLQPLRVQPVLYFPVFSNDEEGKELRGLLQQVPHVIPFYIRPIVIPSHPKEPIEGELAESFFSSIYYNRLYSFQYLNPTSTSKILERASIEEIRNDMPRFRKLFNEDFVFISEAHLKFGECKLEKIPYKELVKFEERLFSRPAYPREKEDKEETGLMEVQVEIKTYLVDFKNQKIRSFEISETERGYNDFGQRACPDPIRAGKMALKNVGLSHTRKIFPQWKETKLNLIRNDSDPNVQKLLEEGFQYFGEGDDENEEIYLIKPGALEVWKLALAQSGNRSEGAFANIAYYYLNNGYLEEAIDWFRKAAVANPDRQRFWNLRIKDILHKREQVEVYNDLNN